MKSQAKPWLVAWLCVASSSESCEPRSEAKLMNTSFFSIYFSLNLAMTMAWYDFWPWLSGKPMVFFTGDERINTHI